MHNHHLIVIPRRAGIPVAGASKLDVLVRLQAPDAPAGDAARRELPEDPCWRHVRLRLAPARGVRARVLNDFRRAGPKTWHLPDLVYGSEGWALVRLDVSADALAILPVPAQVHLLDLEIELVDTTHRERRFLGASLVLPAVGPDAARSLPEHGLVANRARELDCAKRPPPPQISL